MGGKATAQSQQHRPKSAPGNQGASTRLAGGKQGHKLTWLTSCMDQVSEEDYSMLKNTKARDMPMLARKSTARNWGGDKIAGGKREHTWLKGCMSNCSS